MVQRPAWVARVCCGPPGHESATSAPCCEPLLDLIHQRMGEPRLAQLGEVFADDRLPRFLVLYLLAPIAKIKRARLVHAAEEHERIGAVLVAPYPTRRERNGLVGGFECGDEWARMNLYANPAIRPTLNCRSFRHPILLASFATSALRSRGSRGRQ